MSNPYQTIQSRLRYARRLIYRRIPDEYPEVLHKIQGLLKACGLPLDLNLLLVKSKITLSEKPDVGRMPNYEYFGYKLESIEWPRELKMLNETNYNGRRKAELVYRINAHLKECLEKQRYTYWTTLTLDETIVERNAEELRRRILMWRQNIVRKIGEKPRYVAVQEGEDKNPHVHIVWDIKRPPPGWNPPVPDRVEMRPYRVLWPYGISTTIRLRIGSHDVWSKQERRYTGHGYKKLQNPTAVAVYMAKYLTKEVEAVGRIRYSKEYGQWLNKQTLEQMETRLLRPLQTSLNWPDWKGRMDQMPPSSIITSYAKRERQKRIMNSRPCSFSTILMERKQNVFCEIAANFEKKIPLISNGSQVQSGIVEAVDSTSAHSKRIAEAVYVYEHIYRVMGGIE